MQGGPRAAILVPVDLLLDAVRRWHLSGTRCALARVVHTENSAPLPPGAAMAVSEDGEVVGGVSGGCVDGTVFSLCQQAIADGSTVLAEFGGDGASELFEAPTCGGTSRILVHPLDAAGHDALEQVHGARCRGEALVVATALTGPRPGAHLLVGRDGARGSLGDPRLDRDTAHLAAGRLGRPGAHTAHVATDAGGDSAEILLHSFAPPSLLVFGAGAFGEALTRMGALLGYRVVVCDARPALNRPERFPDAAEVVTRWPHEYLGSVAVDQTTAICVLTHDHKFDIPLLRAALRSPAGYVGAMGSRRVHGERLDLLRAEGLTESELGRLRSPIGLDLGARTAEETAVSIAAELVAHKRGGSGSPLARLDVAIHR